LPIADHVQEYPQMTVDVREQGYVHCVLLLTPGGSFVLLSLLGHERFWIKFHVVLSPAKTTRSPDKVQP
jgi:hypothetical protein